MGRSDTQTRSDTQVGPDTHTRSDARAAADTQVRAGPQTRAFTLGSAGRQIRANVRTVAPLGSVLVIVGAVWIALFIVRLHAHQANVDDYFYASVSRSLANTPDPFTALLHTGQNAPLVLALAMPGVRTFGLYGALSVELPLLLILCVGAYALSRKWLSPFAAAITTLAVGLNTAVLAYSVMLNFAIASTAAVVWCFAAYTRSNRLNNLGWSIAFGFAFAMLLLSRSVAPVYAVPLAFLVAADVLVGILRNGQRPWWPGLAAVGTTLVVAGPWWLVSGSQAIDYLTNAGYQASSGYTSGGVHLTLASVVARTRYELFNLGWLEAIALGLLALAALWIVLWHSRARRVSGFLVLAAWVVLAHELMNLGWLVSVALGLPILAGLWFLVRHSRARRLPGLWILVAWVVATLLILSSSANFGTAFGLPLIVATLVVGFVVVGATLELGQPGRRVLVAFLMVMLVVGGVSQFTTSSNPWWHGPPYRGQVQLAGGSSRTNVDELQAQVAESLGPGLAVNTVNSGIMNNNGLGWYAKPSSHLLAPSGTGSNEQIISALPQTRSLITGTKISTFSTFNPFVDVPKIEQAAIRSGLHPARSWTIPNGLHVILWNRGPSVLPSESSSWAPSINRPRDGSQWNVAGGQWLAATVPGTMAASKVTFEVTSSTLSHPLETPAIRYPLGWITDVNVNTLGKGKYTITCIAENGAGLRLSSRAIKLYVK